MSDKDPAYKFDETPRDLFTKTGGKLPDDHDAYVESAEGKLLRGEHTLVNIPDWRPAKSLTKLRSQVDTAHPDRNKSKDGTIGDANHCPNANHTGPSDHCLNIIENEKGIVTAIDITHDAAKCDVDKIVEAIRGDKDTRIKYIIWNKRICSSKKIGDSAAWAWRAYSGDDPHTGHAHFSVKKTKADYDNVAEWKIA
jgi:hypothetical protein